MHPKNSLRFLFNKGERKLLAQRDEELALVQQGMNLFDEVMIQFEAVVGKAKAASNALVTEEKKKEWVEKVEKVEKEKVEKVTARLETEVLSQYPKPVPRALPQLKEAVKSYVEVQWERVEDLATYVDQEESGTPGSQEESASSSASNTSNSSGEEGAKKKGVKSGEKKTEEKAEEKTARLEAKAIELETAVAEAFKALVVASQAAACKLE